MAQSEDIKRRLLHQAVAENVGQISGHRPVPETPPHHHRGKTRKNSRAPVGWLALGLLVIATVALWRLSGSQPEPTAELATPTTVPAPRPRPADDATFSAPQPIDPEVFPLAVRRIVLDAGHGGEDTGAKTTGFTEKELTLDIALRLRELLAAEGFEIAMTRDGDRALNLRERAEMANAWQADLFVSIHLNWIVQASVRGIETYFLGAAKDPALAALAQRENLDSGYTRDEVERLLDGIFAGVRREQSSVLAERVQRSLVGSLRRVNPGLRDRGVKTAPFVVLGATEMPAILAEVSCLSNRDEVALLADPSYRDHIARALRGGIQSYARHVNQTEEQGS